MKKAFYIFLLFTFHFSLITFGQGTVKGVLFDESNGEAVPFANVILDGTTHGCATDLNGFFLISKVPAGKYTLKVRYVGYEEYSQEVTVENRRTATVTIHLKPAAQILKAVEISDSRAEERRVQTQVSVEKLTASQIQQMPSIGGTADIAQYMQVLPGVNSTGDQGGQLYIRGGSMIQNLCLLDGMVVYNPFHSIGLYSIFETDVILNADIYTGGFGAEYGGRLSSVMDIKTRDGNKRHHTGKIGLNTFGASLILEGPLKKETQQSKTTITYLLTAKNSYLSKTSPYLYDQLPKKLGLDKIAIDGGLPFDFLDLYGKFSINSGTGSKASVFGFYFDDSVTNYQAIADYHWRNYGAGANFTVVTGTSAILEGTLAYSDYRITLDDRVAAGTNVTAGDDKYSSINGFNITLQGTNFNGDNRLKYGLSIEGYNTDYQFVNQYSKRISQHEPSATLSVYATYKMNTGSWLLDPGIRLAYYATLGTFLPEPRLAVKYNASSKLRFKMAGGFYSQVFLDARSDNDIVNLFSGFLTGSAALRVPQTFLGKDVKTCVQQAKHIIIGAEYDLTDLITFNAEVYLKYFDQLLNANRNKMYDIDDPVYQEGGIYEKSEYLLTDYIIENGYATGFDLSATVDLDHLYLWATYSLGYVERGTQSTTTVHSTDLVRYNPHYDRRHTVNLLATYKFGAQYDWEISGRWTYGSGFPFTQTQGVYQQLLFGNMIANDYTQENGVYSLHYAELYKGRLPDYHRLDLGVKKRFSLGARSILDVSLSATNVYSRQNIFYFNRTTFERVNQLPFLASLGVSLSF
ncbi:MAG: carboxypeptidase-like regulatory domain-containing protein [Bacteroidales bacterium]|nr:carboxypeptidase-like regulatory domain-containing protein [Bacteroidales bacterium]